MGEAKRRAAAAPDVVYHHTSILRTNLIWMSGVIELEGRSRGAFHPQLGEIQTDLAARRPCIDFPPLAWFSRSIVVPKCLLSPEFQLVSKETGEPIPFDPGVDARALANGIALNRIALGFPLDAGPIIPWPEHFGYETQEGRDLNESAIAVGDDPTFWYVSEEPIDVLRATEFWLSKSKLKPKLERNRAYLDDVRRMVITCREQEGVYIPPSWLTPEQATQLARSIGATVTQ